MSDHTASFCPIDHVAIETADLPADVRFFENVLGMHVCRTQGDAAAPSSVWLDGGIQLLQEPEPAAGNGRFHHLAFRVDSVKEVLERAAPYGAEPVPGKGAHWFQLPSGIRFELKEQKKA